MPYTANEACKTIDSYLGLDNKNKRIIENTKNRGIVVTLDNQEKAVIFVYPLVHKQDNTKNYFDTRDSGPHERAIAWNYAINNGLKYFCIGVNDQVDKYQNYLFSLECDEKNIETLSGTVDGDRSTTSSGNQIIIPNDYEPSLGYERIKNKLGTYISVIHKNKIKNYLEMYDNRPYMLNIEPICVNDERKPLNFKTGLTIESEKSEFTRRNRIVFGAPGTGKSYMINEDRKKLLGEDSDADYERVTFHPDYSYANFVGTYKPVMVSRKNALLSKEDEFVLSVLNDKTKPAQEKYDALYALFKSKNQLSRLPILIGITNPDEDFKLLGLNGLPIENTAHVENNGKDIKKYVNVVEPQEAPNEISYEYVPGPFMRVYVNALRNAQTEHPRPYLLIIEEINRANVAAVFGDVFQLLDRGDDGVSEYPIQASEDIKKYLAKEFNRDPEDFAKIRIPDNMFIWATMNSADQGVFPMDTAFKRRWDFTYIGIDDNDDEIRGKYVDLGVWPDSVRVEWNDLRKAINEFLAEEKINEDKQLGPYFISKNIVVPADGSSKIDSKEFSRVFKNKVLMYLYEDAAKQKHKALFGNYPEPNSSKQYTRYSEICNAFDTRGISIFSDKVVGKLKKSTVLPYKSDADDNAEQSSNSVE